MILIGQYDSPFVRRVAITLRNYQLPFEHRAWSVWANAEQIARYNPLRRVPTLLLDDGSVLVETFSILDALDERVGPERALLPASGRARQDGRRIASFASGIADKAVALLYGTLDLMAPSAEWITRCQSQIIDTLALLETDLAARRTRFWLGDALSHADIAFACSFRFTREANPTLIEPASFPHLVRLAGECESRTEFAEISLPISNPR